MSSYNKENIDELNFLSTEYKNKLKKIASEMSSFLLLSTFRDAERDWFYADREAFDAFKILFDMMGDRISKLIKEMFDGGLVLTSTQKISVLKYLNAETEKNRAATRLLFCSRTFFEKIFNKHSPETESLNNNKRPHEQMPIGGTATFKKIKLNSGLYISLGFQPIGVISTFPLNGTSEQGRAVFQTTYSNEVYTSPLCSKVDANANSLVEMPGNETARSGEKKTNFKTPNQETTKLCKASPSKACKEEEKQKMKINLSSVVGHASAVKKEEKELNKPIKLEAKKKVPKQNRGRELFGNDSDDAGADSDVEITGSYIVAIPDEKKFVSFKCF